MRSLVFIGLGIGFILMGLGLFALTLRKAKASPATPTKAQLREQAALAEENRKMKIAAGSIGGLGVVFIALSFL